jgi:hypothetical protein
VPDDRGAAGQCSKNLLLHFLSPFLDADAQQNGGRCIAALVLRC